MKAKAVKNKKKNGAAMDNARRRENLISIIIGATVLVVTVGIWATAAVHNVNVAKQNAAGTNLLDEDISYAEMQAQSPDDPIIQQLDAATGIYSEVSQNGNYLVYDQDGNYIGLIGKYNPIATAEDSPVNTKKLSEPPANFESKADIDMPREMTEQEMEDMGISIDTHIAPDDEKNAENGITVTEIDGDNETSTDVPVDTPVAAPEPQPGTHVHADGTVHADGD